MNKVQTLNAFWNSFKWPAYDESSVPEDAKMPYITYEVITSDFDKRLSLTASLWDKTYSWAAISEKEQQIADFIGRGGVMVKYDGGAMWISKGDTWAQRIANESDVSVRRILLNIVIEFLD